MNILFATMPFDGHFNPLTGVAMHLKEAGHDVRWYAGPSYAAKLERLGIPHYAFRRATEINGDNMGELFPERANLHGPALLSESRWNQNVARLRDEFSRYHPNEIIDAYLAKVNTTMRMHQLGAPVGPGRV